MQGKFSKMVTPQRVLGLLLAFLLVFGAFVVVYSLINPQFDAITYLAGCSTFVIAVLTVLYVLTTSRQLHVMAGQLEEMRREHELQAQPLPWISLVKVSVEKPRLFYTPPEDRYSAYARYFVEFILKNIGAFPAVCVDVSSRIAIPREPQAFHLNATSVRIDTLEEKEVYPRSQDSKAHFLFPGDLEGALLRALRQNDPQKYPRLLLRVLYKNILGACFVSHNQYLLYPANPEQDSTIRDWLTQITAFPIQYKNELNLLIRLRKSNEQRWEELFDQVKGGFANSLLGEDTALDPVRIPGAFTIKPITNEEYLEATADISYGIALPPVDIPCPAIPRNQL